ncbi:hypothetical protein ACOBQX_00605 [Actinokineospora sp. G85]|uniref:hypothetical protein n=1 Tax=Actinokineospora sp. G85 TaxID=3406626 RepID=UPI003C71AA9E
MYSRRKTSLCAGSPASRSSSQATAVQPLRTAETDAARWFPVETELTVLQVMSAGVVPTAAAVWVVSAAVSSAAASTGIVLFTAPAIRGCRLR